MRIGRAVDVFGRSLLESGVGLRWWRYSELCGSLQLAGTRVLPPPSVSLAVINGRSSLATVLGCVGRVARLLFFTGCVLGISSPSRTVDMRRGARPRLGHSSVVGPCLCHRCFGIVGAWRRYVWVPTNNSSQATCLVRDVGGMTDSTPQPRSAV